MLTSYLSYSGIKAVVKANKNLEACLVVYGTPAEEEGGGKINMIEAGVFNQVDICMMTHPAPVEAPNPTILACNEILITFHGSFLYMSYRANDVFFLNLFCFHISICIVCSESNHYVVNIFVTADYDRYFFHIPWRIHTEKTLHEGPKFHSILMSV